MQHRLRMTGKSSYSPGPKDGTAAGAWWFSPWVEVICTASVEHDRPSRWGSLGKTSTPRRRTMTRGSKEGSGVSGRAPVSFEEGHGASSGSLAATRKDVDGARAIWRPRVRRLRYRFCDGACQDMVVDVGADSGLGVPLSRGLNGPETGRRAVPVDLRCLEVGGLEIAPHVAAQDPEVLGHDRRRDVGG